jgi:hypothetical protein
MRLKTILLENFFFELFYLFRISLPLYFVDERLHENISLNQKDLHQLATTPWNHASNIKLIILIGSGQSIGIDKRSLFGKVW